MPKPTVSVERSTVTFPPTLVWVASKVLPPLRVICSLLAAAIASSNDEVSWKMNRTAVREKSRTCCVMGFSLDEMVGVDTLVALDSGVLAPPGSPPDGAAKMMPLVVMALPRAWRIFETWLCVGVGDEMIFPNGTGTGP